MCNFVWIQTISLSIFVVMKCLLQINSYERSDNVNFGTNILLNSCSQSIFLINKSIVSIKYGIFYDSLTVENEVSAFI